MDCLLETEVNWMDYFRKRGRLGSARIYLHCIRWKTSDQRRIPTEKVIKFQIIHVSQTRMDSCHTKTINLVPGIDIDSSLVNISAQCTWKSWISGQFILIAHLQSKKKQSRLLTSDPITIQPSLKEKKYSLYSNSFDVLDVEIFLSISFTPNEFSFSFLCLSAESNEDFFYQSFEELRRIIHHNDKGDSLVISSKEDKELLLFSIKYLKDLLNNNPQILLSLLTRTHHHSTGRRIQRTSSFGSQSSFPSLLSGSSLTPSVLSPPLPPVPPVPLVQPPRNNNSYRNNRNTNNNIVNKRNQHLNSSRQSAQNPIPNGENNEVLFYSSPQVARIAKNFLTEIYQNLSIVRYL
jgi:hypothetical protein